MRSRFELSVSVFVIARRDEQVLLLRRCNTAWMDGFYSLPAGRHDGGETLDQAAARELLEETGLVVRPEDLQLAHLMHCRSGDSGGEWLGAFFLATSCSGSAVLREPHKHDAVAWFDLHALPSAVIPYTRQGLEAALRGTAFSSFGWS